MSCDITEEYMGGRLHAASQKKEVPVSSSDVSINGVGVGILDDFPAM